MSHKTNTEVLADDAAVASGLRLSEEAQEEAQESCVGFGSDFDADAVETCAYRPEETQKSLEKRVASFYES